MTYFNRGFISKKLNLIGKPAGANLFVGNDIYPILVLKNHYYCTF